MMNMMFPMTTILVQSRTITSSSWMHQLRRRRSSSSLRALADDHRLASSSSSARRQFLYTTSSSTTTSTTHSNNRNNNMAMTEQYTDFRKAGRVRPRSTSSTILLLQQHQYQYQYQQQQHQQQHQYHYYYDFGPVSSIVWRHYTSGPTSNAFWKDLNLAVKHGNGEQAEAIVNGLLMSQQQQQLQLSDEEESSSSSSLLSSSKKKKKKKNTIILDTRIFSLVLEAWKKSDDPILAAERAQQLLDQMMALAQEGWLTEPPSMEDYHAVLECWASASAAAASGTGASGDDNSITLQAAESALRITQKIMMMTTTTTMNAEQQQQEQQGRESSRRRMLAEQTFLLVLRILANGGHAASARQFLEETVRTTITTTNNNSSNSSSSSSSSTDGVLLLSSPASSSITLDMYNLVLEAYARSTQPDAPHAAQALLEDMIKMHNQDDDVESSGNENSSSSLRLLLPQPNGTSYDWVIQCWAAHADRYPEEASQNAQRLLTQMMKGKQRLQTTLASYQNVISILAQQGEAKQAEQLLTSLVKDYGAQFDAQLKPTLVPFETVLLAYSRSFYVDAAQRAESVLTHMLELYETGLLERPPDAWSYNLVLKCWMHSKHPQAADRALKILEQMQTDGVVIPDTSTMNTVLNALAKNQQHQQPERAEQFLWNFYQSHLEDPIRNPQPDVISFGTVLKAWALSNDPQASERAEILLLKLQKLHESGWRHCQPDQAIYSNVMKCYAQSSSSNNNNNNNNKKSHKSEEAAHKVEALLRSMQQAAKEQNNPDLKPDTVCWNMAIQAWAQAGQGPRAEALFKEMLQDYLQDNKETGGAAAAPNNITFSAVLSAWAKTQHNPQAPERAERLLQQMKHLAEENNSLLPDIKPNVVSYSIVLDCLAYAKSTAAAIRAESLLREMQASDDPAVQPNVISYNSVIKAWSLSRDPNALFKVTALLKEMMEQLEQGGNKQMTPNANTFGSILKVLADSHNVPDKEKRARVIVKLMEKFNVPWNEWSRNQMKRCSRSSSSVSSEEGTVNESQRRGRGMRQRSSNSMKHRRADDLPPDLPDLKYS